MTDSDQSTASQSGAGQSAAGQSGAREYRIGLSMSGAISAGAYTAGVFDFLIQALAELDFARANPDHPDHAKAVAAHTPRIVAVTGASAGGITAALGAVSLGYGLSFRPDATSTSGRRPVEMTPRVGPNPIEGVMPGLYNAWVVKPRMLADKGPAMLTTEDLTQHPGRLVSVLNTMVLDEIRVEALKPPAEPPIRHAAPYDFCYQTLHLYLTITNLPGIQYDIRGKNGGSAYHMVTHADRVHVKIGGIGMAVDNRDGWADQDNGDRTDVATLMQTAGQDEIWQKIGHSALATSAFPAGLSARVLSAKPDDFKDRWFPAPNFDGAVIEPVFPPGAPMTPGPLSWANLDGGVINNDPFDFARYALMHNWRDSRSRNERDAALADRSVLMISPFPEGKTVSGYPEPDTLMTKMLAALLPTLLTQVRFKVDELAAAADDNIASRFLIAPRKTQNPDEEPSSVNIACGALGGFGGFMDQKFREHDYILGRRNCQAFLARWTESKFTTEPGQYIVPLVGSAVPPVLEPDWPQMSEQDFKILVHHIGLRGNAVIGALMTQLAGRLGSLLLGWPIKLYWLFRGVPKVRAIIEKDLRHRKQAAF